MTTKKLLCAATETTCPICQPLVGILYDPGSEPTLPIHDGCNCYYLTVDVSEGGITLIHYHPEIERRIAQIRQRTANIQHVVDDLYEQLHLLQWI